MLSIVGGQATIATSAHAEPASAKAEVTAGADEGGSLRPGAFASVGPYYNGNPWWSGELGGLAVLDLTPKFHVVTEVMGTWIVGSHDDRVFVDGDDDVHEDWKILGVRGLLGMRLGAHLGIRVGAMLGYSWLSYESSICGKASDSGVSAGPLAELAFAPSGRHFELGARLGFIDVPWLVCGYTGDPPDANVSIRQGNAGMFSGMSVFFLTLKAAYFF